MIEVEKKFIPTQKNWDQIKKEAVFLKKIIHEDIYYDTKDYFLTSRRLWLRKRDGIFELKVPINKDKGPIDQYQELQGEKPIKNQLKLSQDLSLNKALEEQGIFPFLSFSTQRKKYRLDDFTIDIDHANCEELSYDLAEVEIIVEEESHIPSALQKLKEFFSKFQIEETTITSTKIDYFLYYEKPDHYYALLKAKAIYPISFN